MLLVPPSFSVRRKISKRVHTTMPLQGWRFLIHVVAALFGPICAPVSYGTNCSKTSMGTRYR